MFLAGSLGRREGSKSLLFSKVGILRSNTLRVDQECASIGIKSVYQFNKEQVELKLIIPLEATE